MKLIATLVNSSSKVKDILKEIPENSIVVFPESVSIIGAVVKQYSIDKNLFIIYNSDTKENGKRFITMRGVDKGEEIWQVRKFKLWSSDVEDGFSASKAEPIVNIRGKIGALFICYDLTTIGRDGRLFAMGRVLQKYQPEILLLPANWQFNFKLVENTLDTAMNKIKSLKIGLFSCTNHYALVFTKKEKQKIKSEGWLELEI